MQEENEFSIEIDLDDMGETTPPSEQKTVLGDEIISDKVLNSSSADFSDGSIMIDLDDDDVYHDIDENGVDSFGDEDFSDKDFYVSDEAYQLSLNKSLTVNKKEELTIEQQAVETNKIVSFFVLDFTVHNGYMRVHKK